jgi:hypothetical protein
MLRELSRCQGLGAGSTCNLAALDERHYVLWRRAAVFKLPSGSIIATRSWKKRVESDEEATVEESFAVCHLAPPLLIYTMRI